VATGTLLNRRNRRDVELQLELAGAFSLVLSACTRARRLMAQARERGIEPKLDPELQAILNAYNGLHSVSAMKGQQTYLDRNCEQILGE
jgi:hypothetical protein